MDGFVMYWLHAQQNRAQERLRWEQRRDQAWASAYRAAEVLREQFGATRILAIDSLIRPGPFEEPFDVHLAVSGIGSEEFPRAFEIAAAVVDSLDFDLVNLADCAPALRDLILRSGTPL